jgi:hypothetical protein
MKPRHHGGGFREWLNILYHARNHFQNGNNPDFRLFRKTPKPTQNPKYYTSVRIRDKLSRFAQIITAR